MRRLLFALVFALGSGSGAAGAQCVGQNLIATLPVADQQALRDATDAVPFAMGNLWRATKGSAVVHLVGTYHMEDARHSATLTRLEPLLAEASLLLVEAGPDEMAALKQRLGKEPELMINTKGPTLPELLPPEIWDRLVAALKLRGIPGFMAAKFQPWYVSMLLAVPPCALQAMGEGKGLDALLVDQALADGLPIKALEPYDTVFAIFDNLPEADKLAMVTSALAMDDRSEDVAVTMADLYFSQDARMIWEFMRAETLKLPGYTPEKVAQEFASMEEVMMAQRNRGWIPVIEAAAADGPVLAAFGALHLAGDEGVLQLLQEAGFTVERLALP